MAAGDPLVCPSCASRHPADERFCSRCGMPLVHAPSEASEPVVSERHRRARKIKPQYTEGPLVRVVTARNQMEAEFLAGMLLEEGVPSLIRRFGGFDLLDYMAGGGREILVPLSGSGAAHDILLGTEAAGHDILLGTEAANATLTRTATPSVRRVLAALMLVVAVVAVVLFMATHVWT